MGWTGVACSIDCGCNNHSFCETGQCDDCKNWTRGEHCELCAEGSFGNALEHSGCLACNCHGHGDLNLGLCDATTGHCFCLNNTTGKVSRTSTNPGTRVFFKVRISDYIIFLFRTVRNALLDFLEILRMADLAIKAVVDEA